MLNRLLSNLFKKKPNPTELHIVDNIPVLELTDSMSILDPTMPELELVDEKTLQEDKEKRRREEAVKQYKIKQGIDKQKQSAESYSRNASYYNTSKQQTAKIINRLTVEEKDNKNTSTIPVPPKPHTSPVDILRQENGIALEKAKTTRMQVVEQEKARQQQQLSQSSTVPQLRNNRK